MYPREGKHYRVYDKDEQYMDTFGIIRLLTFGESLAAKADFARINKNRSKSKKHRSGVKTLEVKKDRKIAQLELALSKYQDVPEWKI